VKRIFAMLMTATLCGAAAIPQAEPLVVRGAIVHSPSGAGAPATIVVDNGKILAVGPNATAPANARVVDAGGLHAYPSLINGNTVLGLVEVSSVRGTVDVSEVGDINPNVRAEVALNADSELLPVTRANGVLVAMTAPRGGLVAGTAAVMRLDGWNWEDLTVKAPVGMLVNWPGMRINRDADAQPAAEEQVKNRDARLLLLRDTFANARAYWKARGAEGGKGVPAHERDPRWDAMGPVLRGEIPVLVTADDILKIRAALQWAEQEGVRIVLLAGGDVGRLAGELAKRQVPVILDPTFALPRRDWEPYDTAYTNAARLHAAGVKFCFGTSGGAFGAANARNLPYEAAGAVGYGLPADAALRALTQDAADILGVGDRLGSIDAGKDATFFLSDGDPLDIRSHVVRAFIDGREISLENRQTRLWEKYRSRPPGK